MRFPLGLWALCASSMLTQCRTPNSAGQAAKVLDVEETDGADPQALPTLVDASKFSTEVMSKLDGFAIPANKRLEFAQKIARYMGFLGVQPGSNDSDKILDRLMESSTQFLLCDSFENWPCLEEKPWIPLKQKFRQETSPDLGKRIDVQEPLHIEAYFTNQWDVKPANVDMDKMLAKVLATKINEEARDGMSMAMYGIDEINGSMEAVYKAIIEHKNAGLDVRAVVDTEGFYPKATKAFPWTFSYRKPGNKTWAFEMADEKMSNVQFQYRGTPALMNALNAGITEDDKAVARVEWTNGNDIMHNKFFVFHKGDQMSLWTGTANVADTCMGTERNTNVGLFIDSTELAKPFQLEFEEMYSWNEKLAKAGGKLVSPGGGDEFPIGHFHKEKRPNTPRYFAFPDGIEARVHFAPTDDGEHRSVMPMLLSARKGDIIRIAMFGAGGLDFVRAMQYAQAKGADVRIVLDRLVGSQTVGWLRDPKGNLLDPNPYDPDATAKLVVHRSTSKMKQNHHKSATLTRMQPDGTYRVEEIIIGSQNWSAQGNDANDENMLTLRAASGDVPIGEQFNQHFDERLWVASQEGELIQGKAYCQQVTCSGAESAD